MAGTQARPRRALPMARAHAAVRGRNDGDRVRRHLTTVTTMTLRPSDPAVWDRLRSICGALPNVTEKPSHGEIAWFTAVGKKSGQFATTWDHHHDDRNAVVMAAPAGAPKRVVAGDPRPYFRPPHGGGQGGEG